MSGRPLDALDPVPESRYAAQVATLPCRSIDAVGSALVEDPVLVLRKHGEQIEHERCEPTLSEGDHGDTQLFEPLPGGSRVGEITTQPVHFVQPQLVEPACLGRRHERSSARPLDEREPPRDAVVAEPLDHNDIWFALEPTVKLVGLGLDGLALPLVVRADPLVGHYPPDLRDLLRNHHWPPL